MKLVSGLTPAETLLILKGSRSTQHELLNVTLMDLLLKHVLSAKQHTTENGKTFTYILTGKNFSMHRISEHELIFLKPFQKNKSLKILPKNLVEIARKKTEKLNYQKLVRKSSRSHVLFKQKFLQWLVGSFSLTVDGSILKEKIQEELHAIEKELPGLIAFNPEKLDYLLQTIGGHIFLFTTIDFSIIPQVNLQVLDVTKNPVKQNSTSDYSSGCNTTDCSNFLSDFGCSNDSGCSASGCSGCGGGCGGGD